MYSREINLEDNSCAITLFGEHGSNLAIVEGALDVKIDARGNTLALHGGKIDVELAAQVINQLYDLVALGYPLHGGDVESALGILKEEPSTPIADIFMDRLSLKSGKRVIHPKSLAQKIYIDAVRNNDIVFGIGPAGTGKTYLAMAMAVSSFLNDMVERIVLVRPAVEAGERLGFLPGDLEEKVNPYLRPLYDALYDMLSFERVARLLERGVIEIAPLAFMRGRTLNNAFIILDEAQNTTSEQMKMFLTRLGYQSKAVITGDITQIDLPDSRVSGLLEAKRILQGIKGIHFSTFGKRDVVRHSLVKKIIEAYERLDETAQGG